MNSFSCLAEETGYWGEYISDTIPDQIQVGTTGQYIVTFRNTGSYNWEHERDKIGVRCFTNDSGILIKPEIVLLPQGFHLPTGQSYQFLFTITSLKEGYYDLKFAAVHLVNSEPEIISEMIGMRTYAGRETSDGLGGIKVSCGEINAEISMDGIYRGVSPCTIMDVPPGKHLIVLTTEGEEKEYEVKVEQGLITVVTVDLMKNSPVIRYLSFMQKKDEENDHDPFSELLMLLGIFIILTGGGSLLTIGLLKKFKKPVQIEVISPFEPSPKLDLDHISEECINMPKDRILIRSSTGSCVQGEICFIKVRISNFNARPIQIEGKSIKPKESGIITLRMPSHDPGDVHEDRDLTFLDGAGRELLKRISVFYHINIPNLPLQWEFSKFICRDGKITALFTIKNLSKQPVIIGKNKIFPDTEDYIEIEPGNILGDNPYVYRSVSFCSDTQSGMIWIRIPYNNGVILWASGDTETAMAYLDKVLEGIPDAPDIHLLKSCMKSDFI